MPFPHISPSEPSLLKMRMRASAPGQGSVSFRVPRQADNSLTMRAIVPGADLGDIPIGEYIARMGYDWGEESLRDITVIIDLVIGGVMITVNDWEEGAWFDLVTL